MSYSQQNDDSHDNIPSGYLLINGPNYQQYLVPSFMADATLTALEVEHARKALNLENTGTGPRTAMNAPWQGIAEGQVTIPADPPLSDREALELHAEVKALQARLGISYKDAAHRLYMAEIAKLNSEKDAEASMMKIKEIIDNTVINDLYPPLMKIDSGELDVGSRSADVEK